MLVSIEQKVVVDTLSLSSESARRVWDNYAT